MAELEIHTEGAENDPQGKRVGAMAAIIAILLAIVTILSHRAHTSAVVLKTEANDQWAFYQAKSLKSHTLSVGRDLLTALEVKKEVGDKILERYEKERQRYEKEGEEIKREAGALDAETKVEERRALRFDLGEGMLEIGLVLSSLYFIARRQMFPIVGLIAAATGIVIGLSGLFVN